MSKFKITNKSYFCILTHPRGGAQHNNNLSKLATMEVSEIFYYILTHRKSLSLGNFPKWGQAKEVKEEEKKRERKSGSR